MATAVRTRVVQPRQFDSTLLIRPEHPSIRSCAAMAGLCSTHRLVDDVLSHRDELVMITLAHRPQPLQRLLICPAAPAHHDADRPIDDAPGSSAACRRAASRWVWARTLAFCT